MTEVEIRENFARNLTVLRKSRGLTQLKLAEGLNYSDKSVSKWENGDVLPDVVTLSLIADYFGITVDRLISKDLPKKAIAKSFHSLIYLLSCGLPLFIASLIFLVLFPLKIENAWMTFIYALPVSAIVSIVLTNVWFKLWSVALSVSGLVWLCGLAFFLSFLVFAKTSELWFTFIVCAIMQVFVILFFVAKAKKNRLKNSEVI